MTEEQSAQNKADEFKLILQSELEALEESFQRRLDTTREAQEVDRIEARQRAEELFPEGSLGTVDEGTSSDILGLVADRRSQLGQVQSDTSLSEARQAELDRVTSQFDDLLAAQDPNSAANKARRENAELGIQRQLQGNLGRISALSNARGTRVQTGLVGDALQGAVDAQAAFERDMLIAGDEASRDIISRGAAARGESLTRQEDVQARQRDQVNQLQSRLEDLQGAIREDTLKRQLINLENRREEVFGRLGTEESRVAQGIAERTGVREQVLAESNSAEARRHQRESERLQEIEANKPPPSGGGGKVICTAHYIIGNIDLETLKGDYAWSVQHVTPNMRRGYWCWGIPLANSILSDTAMGHFNRMWTRPFACAWAREMAYQTGYAKSGSVLGKVLCFASRTVVAGLGAVLNYIKPEACKEWV